MLTFNSGLKIYLATEPYDMRKSFNGLSVVVREKLRANPLGGAAFLFTNKRRNLLKILYWDGSGLWVLSKRLEKGRYSWPSHHHTKDSKISLEATALAMLTDGIDLCLKGKSKEIDAQIAKFEAQLKQDPKDYLAQVYLGSACALRSKASFWGPSKLKYLKRGQELMDQAVEKAPNDHRVRMVRAIGSYKVPKKFNRRPVAISDFKTLVPAAQSKKNDLATNERQAILYYAYLTYKEAGMDDAAKVKAACHKLAPDSEYGKLTR